MANTESAIGCGHAGVQMFCSPILGVGTEIHCRLGMSFGGEGGESWVALFSREVCVYYMPVSASSFTVTTRNTQYALLSGGPGENDHPA